MEHLAPQFMEHLAPQFMEHLAPQFMEHLAPQFMERLAALVNIHPIGLFAGAGVAGAGGICGAPGGGPRP
jgi:hypothetical protein